METLSTLTQSSFGLDHPVARSASGILTWGQFLADIAATQALLDEDVLSGWALFEEDSYRFAVGLFALLAAGKRVYIPGENHAGTVEMLSSKGVRFLGTFSAADNPLAVGSADFAASKPLVLKGEIVVFTSGSTGNAKSIPKSLAQIDSELLAQECLWGERLGVAGIMGTVSHQHFYGLLFCILWPLCSGRCFWRRPFVDPVAMAKKAAFFERSAWVMSPAHLHRLGGDMPWEKEDDSLRAIFSSGGPLAKESAQKILTDSGHLPVEIFGSSETGGIAWRQQKTEQASWMPLPGVEVSYSDMGALMVRSPFLASEDWYTTEDAAVPVPEGGFLLGDRLDRIVKIEGKRVSLPEVEGRLLDFSSVAEASAVVLSRNRRCVGALLVLTVQGEKEYERRGRKAFIHHLRIELGRRLSAAAVPRVFRFMAKMPRNSQGKLLFREIMQLFDSKSLPIILQQEVSVASCHLQLAIPVDCCYFEGHFPGTPILPGVVQLKWADHFAREFLGVDGLFLGMQAIKFKKPVFPGTLLDLHLQYTAGSGRLEFSFKSSKGQHSQGRMSYEVCP